MVLYVGVFGESVKTTTDWSPVIHMGALDYQAMSNILSKYDNLSKNLCILFALPLKSHNRC